MIAAPLAWLATHDLGALNSRRLHFALEEVEDGAASPHVFRDAGGGYWWMQDTARWLVRRGSAWVEASPPDRVEGLAMWSTLVPAPRVRDDRPVAPTDVTAALARRIEDLRDDYAAGVLDSDTAAEIAGSAYVVLRDGTVWMPGFASGRWYRFAQSAWSVALMSPSAADAWRPTDAPSAVDEAIVASITAFFEAERPLPEPITAPWTPPSSPPAA